MTDTDPHGIEPDDATRELDAMPSADGLLAQINRFMGEAEGWGGINDAGQGLAKQRQAAQAAFKREANIVRDAFMTDAGRKCLDLMIEQTLYAQPYPPEACLPMDAIAPLVIAHNAQCNFVWSILQAIAQAENIEAKPRMTA